MPGGREGPPGESVEPLGGLEDSLGGGGGTSSSSEAVGPAPTVAPASDSVEGEKTTIIRSAAAVIANTRRARANAARPLAEGFLRPSSSDQAPPASWCNPGPPNGAGGNPTRTKWRLALQATCRPGYGMVHVISLSRESYDPTRRAGRVGVNHVLLSVPIAKTCSRLVCLAYVVP